MIAYLAGQVISQNPTGLIINVQGVGYEVRISPGHMAHFALSPGDPIELTTYLSVKEDGMELFGFPSPQDKEIFLHLTRVSGIGPKTALGMFSVLDRAEIVKAIVGNQPRTLSKAPGIGPKSAQRIILELRERLAKMQAEAPPLNPEILSDLPAGWQEEIELTLLALGYDSGEIALALQQYAPELKQQKNSDEALRVLLTRLED